MGIESACIPLPSEIIMPFSGYLVYTGRFQVILGGYGRRYRVQPGFGRGVLGGGAWRPGAGGALRQICPSQPA